MVAFKISFIVITLVLISAADYGSADQNDVNVCKEVLENVQWFGMGNNDGLKNFKHSFKNLSIKQIEEKRFPHDNSLRKALKHTLAIGYFLDLYSIEGINFDNAEFPDAWCSNFINVELCELYTSYVLFNGEVPDEKEAVFRFLYENWSNVYLTNAKLPYANEETLRLISYYSEDYEFNIGNFSLQYFNQFLLLVNQLEPSSGHFKSVEEYCMDKGHLEVLSSRGAIRNINF